MQCMSLVSGSSALKASRPGTSDHTTPRLMASRRRALPAVLAVLAALVGMGFGASSAWAGVSLGTSPDIPVPNGPVTLGQTGLASTLTITNISTQAQATQTITLDTITMVPSCGVIASINCPAASFEPDVFAMSATGTGSAGTACDGTVFTISNIDELQDKYLFTPSVPVVLGPSNTGGLPARCEINFTVDVLKMPVIDARADPGVQTNELAGANGTATDQQTGQGTGTNFTTVNPAQPAITTTASASIVLGAGTLSDSATVTGRVNPAADATITFSLFGPDNANCSGEPIFTSTVPYPQGGGSVSSGPFTPTVAGNYRWVASYSGDVNNLPVSGACNDANESTTVTTPPSTPPPAPPPPPAVTPPPPPPPAAAALPETCTPAPGPAPAGGELCPPGTARISGATGCKGTTFRVNVTGRQITSVVFTRDGKRVATLRKPNRGSAFSISINPRALKFGTHRVVARTTFSAASGTKPRTLRVVFSRCARAAVSPRFTG